MEEFVKKTGWTSIVSSLITAIIGIAIICNPEIIMNVVAYVLGIVFIGIGIVKLVSYFAAKGTYDFFNYEIIFGILAIVLGIVVIAYRDTIGEIFRVTIGVWVLYSGLMRLGLVTKLKALGINEWKGALILAVLMFICGIFIIASKGVIATALGVAILIYSIIDIIEGIIFLRNVDQIF